MVFADSQNVLAQTSDSSKKNHSINDPALGYVLSPSTCDKNATIAVKFIRDLLRANGFSDTYSRHIAQFAWRDNTLKSFGPSIRRWGEFCKKRDRDPFALKVEDILECLYYFFEEENHTFHMISHCKTTLLELRKISGQVVSNVELHHFEKFLRSCFNKK